ncbi:hypothetical protein RU639_013464 [Aspergillus parasiticus]
MGHGLLPIQACFQPRDTARSVCRSIGDSAQARQREICLSLVRILECLDDVISERCPSLMWAVPAMDL